MGKTRKVGNGEGSLYYNKKQKRWEYGYHVNKKRKKLIQRKKETKADFTKRITQLKSEINTGTYIEKSSETIRTLVERHITQKFRDSITGARSYNRDKLTLQQLEKCCENFINKPIQKVTLYDIQLGKENMKDYSQSCIDKMWRFLKNAFAIASSPSIKLVSFNIMADETLRKPLSNKKTKKVYPLTKEERERLKYVLDHEEKDHKYRNIVKMEWLTAMRVGEVLARSEKDIAKDKSTLHIHNTLTQDEHGNIILGEHTKTYDSETDIDEGERYFPISAELGEIIDKQLSSNITNFHGLLFWDYEKNTFISGGEINAWLGRINKKYHISDKSLHNHRLRHDRITKWKEAGMDIEAIQYLAGHVEGSKVTDDYIDVSQEFAFEQLKKAN